MNDAATRPSEFGTGLRARIAHGRGLEGRRASPSSRDLVRLCAGDAVERPSAQPPLPGRDRAVLHRWGVHPA